MFAVVSTGGISQTFIKKGACNGLYLPGKLLFGKPSRAREFQKITVKHNLK